MMMMMMRVMLKTLLLSTFTLQDGHLLVFVWKNFRIIVSCSDRFSRIQLTDLGFSIKQVTC